MVKLKRLLGSTWIMQEMKKWGTQQQPVRQKRQHRRPAMTVIIPWEMESEDSCPESLENLETLEKSGKIPGDRRTYELSQLKSCNKNSKKVVKTIDISGWCVYNCRKLTHCSDKGPVQKLFKDSGG